MSASSREEELWREQHPRASILTRESEATAKRNLQLMEAAPELLEAAKNLLEKADSFFGVYEDFDVEFAPYLNELSFAIEKAEA